ncbi:MAG: sugar phosphate isomerase/epimerase [Treponema sp.]|jgi:sugar phosphate isomerase/epimerase|nr:sugar phosphate isomerase/epimerase [Treponema sp.]
MYKTGLFKTSVITDEIDQDFETACNLAAEYALDAVEIRSVYERGPFEFTGDDIRRMKTILSEKGLKVCAISSPFFKCKMEDAEEIKTHLKGLEACVRLADELGAGFIRGFTFWAGSDGFDPAAIASRFDDAVAILEKSGKTLVLESDPGVRAANGRMLSQVIEAVGSEKVRGLWDPGNDIWDPNGEIPYPDGYHYIKPWMAHVHMKDGVKKNGKAEGAPIGKGEVDWEGQLRALLADGYSGYISLETHYRLTQKISEELLAMPKGAAFSLGGYEATRESLDLWKTLMDKIANNR